MLSYKLWPNINDLIELGSVIRKLVKNMKTLKHCAPQGEKRLGALEETVKQHKFPI